MIKKVIFLIFIGLLCPAISFASEGDLNINNQAIYNRDEKIGIYEEKSLIEQELFLDKMNQTELEHQKNKNAYFNNLKKQNFNNQNINIDITKDIENKLFPSDYAINQNINLDRTEKTHTTNYIVIILSIVIFCFLLLIIGIIIGKKYTLYKRRKNKEVSQFG